MTIAVDVTHLHAQAEVERLGKRLAIGTDESIGAPRHALKHTLPVVEIKGIRLAKLDQPPVNDLQSLGVLAGHHRLTAHLPYRERPAIAQQRKLAEVGHVQVKIAVVIHVAKCKRRAGCAALQAGLGRDVGKLPLAVIQQAECARAKRGEKQVK